MSASALLSVMTGVVPNGAATSAATDTGASLDASVGGEFASLLDQTGMEMEKVETDEVSDTSEDVVNPMAMLPVMALAPSPNQMVIDLPLTEDAASALLAPSTEAASETVIAEPAAKASAAEFAPVATDTQAAEAAGDARGASDNAAQTNGSAPNAAAPDAIESAAPAEVPVAEDLAPASDRPDLPSQTAQTELAPKATRGTPEPAPRAELAQLALQDDGLETAPAEEIAVETAVAAAERVAARAAADAAPPVAVLPAEPVRKYTAGSRLTVDTVEDAPIEAAPTGEVEPKVSAENADAPAAEAKDAGGKLAVTAAAGFATAEPEVVDAAPQRSEQIEAATQQTVEPKGTELSHATIRTTAELAAAMITRLGHRTTRFDMVLTPETLGNVEVSIEVGNDGQMSARLAFENPQAANELRARADELRRQLADAGFDVSEKSLEFTDRESDPRGGFNQFMSDSRSGRRAFVGAARLAELADTPVAPVWTPLNHARTGVDMKV